MLSRPNVIRLIAGACLVACAAIPGGVARAGSTQEDLAATRKQLDAAAQRWFDAQNKAASTDAHIAQLEHDMTTAEARVARSRLVASARARLMYESSSVDYTSMIGTSAMDSARRAQLIGRANDQDAAAIDGLVASIDDLKAQRKVLVAERARRHAELADVASKRAALDAHLATLLDLARRDAATAARLSAARELSVVRVAATADAPPTAPPGPTAPRPQSRPPSGGGSPHHNDPFLVCTRARESGGNYGVANGNGYYGAYQFLPSTWDTAAAHAGRMDLVGVLPSRASVSDQDEMAWVLYQWQGKGPWGGRC